MSIQIKVPHLGESIPEATLGKWKKKQGDMVKKDELLVELETDKINLEINAEADGVLASIVAKEGSIVTIGSILGTIDPAADKKSAAEQEKSAAKPIGKPDKMAEVKPIETPTVKYSKDLEILNPEEERVPMSRLRQKIAERLKESQNTAAILTTFNEVDMSNVIEVREKYKDEFLKKHNVKLGFMSFFVKAVVEALKTNREINAEIDGSDIIYKNYYDIGVAVGTDKGLVVPVIRNADKLSFAEIEKEIADFAMKAKESKLTMEDLSGGTFSITNGGVYGSLFSTPIINPPQSGILGMHNIVKRPMVVHDRIEIRSMMYLALSYDHRIVDGKSAITFLVDIKKYIECPTLFALS